MRIVLTGKARDHLGNFIDRDTLTQWLAGKGHIVCDRVDRFTDVLVASRSDTIKARTARENGITVQDYTTFLAQQGYINSGGRGANYLGDQRISRRDPDAAPAPARFIGTARPGSANVNDIWQPGGEGPMWRYQQVTAPSPYTNRRFDWVRVHSDTEDEAWEFNKDAVRTPTVFTDDTVPTEPMVGDRWQPRNFDNGNVRFLYVDGDLPGWTIDTGQPRLEAMVRDYYRNNNLPSRQYRNGCGALVHNFVIQHWPALVKLWRETEQAKMDEEQKARDEAERLLRERAPRFNAISPKRSIDL